MQLSNINYTERRFYNVIAPAAAHRLTAHAL